jgi:hypothetical protein
MRWIMGCVLCVMACSGGGKPAGDAGGDPPIDAPFMCKPTAAPTVQPTSTATCDPLAQTGCAAGEKCTWITGDHIGCAPAGPVQADCACSTGAGYDDCEAGAFCLQGVCRTVCDPNAANACSAMHACSRYTNLFAPGGVIIAGLCDPTCDPLTQAMLDTNAAPACASQLPSQPDRGCYTFDYVTFSCAPANRLDLTDRTVPATDSAGNSFVNGCAPGFMPFFLEQTGSTRALCTGLCAPLETDNTQPQNAIGDPAALAKLPTDPAPIAGHATCAIGIKGSETPEDCLFLWPFLLDSTGKPSTSPYNDTLGVCFAFSHFTYDPGDGTKLPIPGCETLPPPDPANPAAESAADWGCYTSAHSQAKPAATLRDMRLGYGPGIARRPTLVSR